jgi:RNA polymerase sigma factor (sigma-70 family)
MKNIQATIALALTGTNREKTTAFNKLFNEFYPKALLTLQVKFRNSLTEDEIEDAAIMVMKNVLSEKTLSNWKPDYQFSSLVTTAATHKGIDIVRSKKEYITPMSHMISADGNLVECAVSNNNPERIIMNKELKEIIYKAFESLSDINRKIADLYFIRQLGSKEVHEITGMNEITYRVGVLRVKGILQKELLGQKMYA